MPAAVVTIYYGEGGTAKLLILSQVILSLQLPFAIIPLVWLTSRGRVMGSSVNRRRTTVAAATCGAVIVVLNAWLLSGLILGG